MKETEIKQSIDNRLKHLTFQQTDIAQMRVKPRAAYRKRVCITATAAVLCLAVALSTVVFSPQIYRFAINQIEKIMPKPKNVVENNGVRIEATEFKLSKDTLTFTLSVEQSGLNSEVPGEVFDTIELKPAFGENGTKLVLDYNLRSYNVPPMTTVFNVSISNYSPEMGSQFQLDLAGLKVTPIPQGTCDLGITLKEILKDVAQTRDTPASMLEEEPWLKEYAGESGVVKLLAPDGRKIQSSIRDWGYISNIGVIDGKLHVQIRYINGKSNYMFSIFYAEDSAVKDKNKEPIYFRSTTTNLKGEYAEFPAWFKWEEDGDYFEENVFEISEDSLKELNEMTEIDSSKLAFKYDMILDEYRMISNDKWSLVIDVPPLEEIKNFQ